MNIDFHKIKVETYVILSLFIMTIASSFVYIKAYYPVAFESLDSYKLTFLALGFVAPMLVINAFIAIDFIDTLNALNNPNHIEKVSIETIFGASSSLTIIVVYMSIVAGFLLERSPYLGVLGIASGEIGIWIGVRIFLRLRKREWRLSKKQ